MEQYLVLDIGGTLIKYALMDADAALLEQGKVPSPMDSLDGLLAAVEGIGRQYAGRYAGAAVSMPGRIDTAAGVAHTGGAFPFIRDTPVGALFGQRLGCRVCVANDAKCAANAEAWRGALADTPNGAVIVLGTGTGGGIVLGHRIWMGNTGAAGELSFLPVDFAGLCANAGPTFAQHASATGLLAAYAARKGLESAAGLDGLAFFAAYDAGDADAAAALDTFAAVTAAGIYAIQSVLDLGRYAIGGGISARPEVVGSIRRKVDDLYTAIPYTAFGKPEIVPCRYGNDANLIGALRFLLCEPKEGTR